MHQSWVVQKIPVGQKYFNTFQALSDTLGVASADSNLLWLSANNLSVFANCVASCHNCNLKLVSAGSSPEDVIGCVGKNTLLFILFSERGWSLASTGIDERGGERGAGGIRAYCAFAAVEDEDALLGTVGACVRVVWGVGGGGGTGSELIVVVVVVVVEEGVEEGIWSGGKFPFEPERGLTDGEAGGEDKFKGIGGTSLRTGMGVPGLEADVEDDDGLAREDKGLLGCVDSDEGLKIVAGVEDGEKAEGVVEDGEKVEGVEEDGRAEGVEAGVEDAVIGVKAERGEVIGEGEVKLSLAIG